jgi:hypothetical protein
MALFKVRLIQAAEAEFLAVPFPIRRQINQEIHKLKDNPTPEDCEILDPPTFQLPVHGWFLLYEVDDERRVVSILRIFR